MSSGKTGAQTLLQVILFIKDTQLFVLFMGMFKTEWFIAFVGSPLSLVVRPLLALSLLALAVMQIYYISTIEKRTAEHWIMAILGGACVLLSNISVWGGIVSFATGVAFVAGPICFLASLVVGALMQTLLAVRNGYLAFTAEQNSVERMHQAQALVQNLLLGAQFVACSLAMVFALVVPISPVVTAVCSIVAVSLILSMIIWRLVPHEYKLTIKSFCGFAKPEEAEKEQSSSLVHKIQIQNSPEVDEQTKVAPNSNPKFDSSRGLRFFSSETQSELEPLLSSSMDCRP